jgi:hypothetical protein
MSGATDIEALSLGLARGRLFAPSAKNKSALGARTGHPRTSSSDRRDRASSPSSPRSVVALKSPNRAWKDSPHAGAEAAGVESN